jgi:hypothetical protein
LAAATTALKPHPITLAAGQGTGAALAAVGPGEVRGAAWLDTNRDGLRQPWEAPLAGVPVSVAGQTAVTDQSGRFVFVGIPAGAYQPVAALPDGLHAIVVGVTVSAGRGAAVGIAAVERRGWSLYLPVVSR